MLKSLRIGGPRRTAKSRSFTVCRSVSHGAHSPARIPASVLLQELRAFAARESGYPVDSRRNLREALGSLDFPKDFSADCADVLLEKKVAMEASDKFAFSCTGCGACCRSFSDTVQVDAADAAAMSIELARQTSAASKAAVPSALVLKPSAFRQEVGFFSTAALPRGAQAVSLSGQAFLPPQLQALSSHLVHVQTFDVTSSAGEAGAWVDGSDEDGGTAAAAADAAAGAGPSVFDAAAAGSGAVSRSADGFGAALTPRALVRAAAEDDVAGSSAGPGQAEQRPCVWTTGWAVGPQPEPLTLGLTGGLAPIIYLQSRSVKDALTRSEKVEGQLPSPGRHRRRRASASSAPTEATTTPAEPESQPVVTIADDADRVCPFAVPGPRHAPPVAARPAATAGRGRSSSSPSPTSTSGLRCSLGGSGMPYTCALYPLGDMWARQVQVSRQVQVRGLRRALAAADGLQDDSSQVDEAADGLPNETSEADKSKAAAEVEQLYYALDHKRCEGVAQVRVGEGEGEGGVDGEGDIDVAVAAHQPFAAAAPPLASVAAYRSAPHRQLAARRARAEWFRRMATAVAALQMDARLAAAAESAAAAAGELAYAHALLQARKAADGAVGPDTEKSAAVTAAIAAAASDESIFQLPGTRRDRESDSQSADPAASASEGHAHAAGAIVKLLIDGLKARGAAAAAAVSDADTTAAATASPAAAAAGPGPGPGLTADGCSAFALDLLAQAWYYHQHGLPGVPGLPPALGKAANASSSSEHSTGEGEGHGAWRQWKHSVEACTAAALAHLHAAATALQAAAAAWESRALATRVQASALPRQAGEGAGSGMTVSERSGGSLSGISGDSRGRTAGRRKGKASSSGSSRGWAGQSEAAELPPTARREAAAKGAMLAQQLAARLLMAPSHR